jgi:hypothetical protein
MRVYTDLRIEIRPAGIKAFDFENRSPMATSRANETTAFNNVLI